MKILKIIVLGALLFSFQLLLAEELNPQEVETKKKVTVEEMSIEDLLKVDVVSASLRSQEVVKTPSKVIVIDKKKIQARNYRYLADILADLPGVRLSLFAASPDSGSSEIITRGISGNNKVVLMWNGQRLNHPDAQALHVPYNLYPLFDVDRVEIVYGPASALYGSDTVSMTVNIITNSPPEQQDKPDFNMGFHYGRYNEIMAYANFKNIKGPVKIDAAVNYFNTAGIDFSNYLEWYTRYPDGPGTDASYTTFPKEAREEFYHPDEMSLTARVLIELGKLSLQAYYQRFQTQSQLGWSPIIYAANHEEGQYIFNQMGFQLSHRYRINFYLNIESTIQHTHAQLAPESHWSRPNEPPFLVYSPGLPGRGVGTRTYKLNYGNRTNIQEKLTWTTLSGRLNTILGFSFTNNDMMPKTANLDYILSYNDSFSSQIKDPQKFHNLTETNLGFFLQFQYELSRKFTLTAGGRYDRHSRYGSTFNPRLVINYFDEGSGFFAKLMAGTSFLAPAAFFTYDTFHIPRDSEQVPNPALKPEKSQTYELNLGKIFQNVVVEASIFITKINNLIMQKQVKSVQELTDELGTYTFTTFHTINSGETDIHGASIELTAKLPGNIVSQFSYTYVDGETRDVTNVGEPYDLIHAPQHMAGIGVDFSLLKEDSLNIYLNAVYTGKARYHPENYRFPASDNGGVQYTMPAYWLVNASVSTAINRHFSLHFKVNNLFDKEYQIPIVGQETSSWVRVAYTPGMPRTFFVGFNYKF